MNLKLIVKKLTSLSKRIEAEKGPLELFGILLRDDSLDLWEIVIAAPWMKADERRSFEYVANHVKRSLSKKDLRGLSGVVILEHGGAVLYAFLHNIANRLGLVDVSYSPHGGEMIKKAFMIVAGLDRNDAMKSAKKPRPKKVRLSDQSRKTEQHRHKSRASS